MLAPFGTLLTLLVQTTSSARLSFLPTPTELQITRLSQCRIDIVVILVPCHLHWWFQDRRSETVSFNYLRTLVVSDDVFKRVEGMTSHEVMRTNSFNAEPLDCVLDVEEERVVARRSFTLPDQETARSHGSQGVHCFLFRDG